jgi:hypothetical protein
MRKYIFLINSPWLPRITHSDGAAFVKYEQFGRVAHPLLGGRVDARAVERRAASAITRLTTALARCRPASRRRTRTPQSPRSRARASRGMGAAGQPSSWHHANTSSAAPSCAFPRHLARASGAACQESIPFRGPFGAAGGTRGAIMPATAASRKPGRAFALRTAEGGARRPTHGRALDG